MLAKNNTNLNQISFNAAYSLIYSMLNKGYNVTMIYIDTAGNKDIY